MRRRGFLNRSKFEKYLAEKDNFSSAQPKYFGLIIFKFRVSFFSKDTLYDTKLAHRVVQNYKKNSRYVP